MQGYIFSRCYAWLIFPEEEGANSYNGNEFTNCILATFIPHYDSDIIIYAWLILAGKIHIGISIKNSVPWPKTELQINLPAWVSSTIFLAIANPKPVPLPTPLVVNK